MNELKRNQDRHVQNLAPLSLFIQKFTEWWSATG